MRKSINPLDIINHIDREFDGLIGKLVNTARTATEMGPAAPATTSRTAWTPAMSVTESADQFEVTLDAPGMQSDAFDIEFVDGQLKVSGERAAVASDDVKWHRTERRFGSFSRSIGVSDDVDVGGVDAEYRDGVLRIILPKKAAVKPTKINVR